MAITLLAIGIDVFWTGYHNVDICSNEELLSCQMDVEIKELRVPNGEEWSLTECYLRGLYQLRKGLFISLIGVFCVGFLLDARGNTI